jgi:hypothetical protein
VSIAMVNPDGMETDYLHLPEKDKGSDAEDSECEEGSSISDPERHTLPYRLWRAGNGNGQLIERLLDLLEAEGIGAEEDGMEGLEIQSDSGVNVTQMMRDLLEKEARENEESKLDYIESLRQALYRQIEKDKQKERQLREEREAEVALRQSTVGVDLDSGNCNVPPQGRSAQAYTMSHEGTLAPAAAASTGVGHTVGTAQTGGNPV